MMMKRILVFALCAGLTGCGTQDYSNDNPNPPPPNATVSSTDADVNPSQIPPEGAPSKDLLNTYSVDQKTGVAWTGIDWLLARTRFGADLFLYDVRRSVDQTVAATRNGVQDFKCFMRDQVTTPTLVVPFQVALSGALIGFITRIQGHWYFGRPVKHRDTFWNWQNSRQGMWKGGMAAVGCQGLLQGFGLTNGLLGSDFAVLAAGVSTSLAYLPTLFAARKISRNRPIISSDDLQSSTNRQIAENRHPDLAKAIPPELDKIDQMSLDTGKAYSIGEGLWLLGITGGLSAVIYTPEFVNKFQHFPVCESRRHIRPISSPPPEEAPAPGPQTPIPHAATVTGTSSGSAL